MRHKLLVDYLQAVEQAVTALPFVYVEQYQEEWITAARINLRIRIRLADVSIYLTVSSPPKNQRPCRRLANAGD